jgi:LPXTG-motif cell wall-anchored protein
VIGGTRLGGWPGGLSQAPPEDTPTALLGILGLLAIALAGGAAYRRRQL